MKAWRETTLGAICAEVDGEIQTGPFGSQLHESDYAEEGVPVVMPKDIREGLITTDSIARVESHHAKRLSRYVLREGDIVFGRRGDIGRQALARKEQDGWLCGTGCLLVRLGHSVVDPLWLHFFLKQDEVVGWLAGQAIGATLPNLNTSILHGVPIRLPDLPTQRRIAGILSAYDELIANNQRRIAVLEQMARALYREWFVYFRAPGVVMKEGAELPEGWEVKKLGEIADIRKGLSYKGEFLDDEQGAPMVNLKCVTPGGGFRRDGVKGYTGPFKEHQSVRPGDIVFANTDLTQAGFIIGSAALVPRLGFEDGGLATHHICIAHEKTGIASKGFLYFTLNDERFREFARGRASGTTVLGFRTSDAEDYDVQLPPSQIMERFTAVVQPILDLIETRAEQVANLRRTRDLLLPRLMSGRVEVTQIEANVAD